MRKFLTVFLVCWLLCVVLGDVLGFVLALTREGLGWAWQLLLTLFS